MARLIESEADHSSSSALDNPTSATLNTNGKMSSVEILNNTTSSPRKFSFKTKQYNHNHYQPKLVTSKIKINPNSTVAELANKFNTIIVDDGDKTNRHHVILKRKHSVGNNNTVIKELPNNVKEAIRLFEQSNSKERNNNVKKDSEPKSNEQTKKSSKIILIRKNSIQRVKKIASTGDISTQIKSESYSNLKRSEIDLKGTSCETCLTLPQLRPTLSLGSNINAPMKIRRPSSIGNSLNQNTSSNQNKTSKSECENLLSNIRKNLRHTSMINLNNSSHRSDHSYEHKISDKYLINKYNTLKPELKPKPEQDFIKDRRKSVSDIQILFKNTNQDLINSKVIQNNFPQRTKFQLKSNKNQNVDQVKKSVSIEDIIAKNNVENITNSNNEINKELTLIKNKSNESENEHGLVNKNIKTNGSISTDHKKNLEVEDKIIKNNRLSIPKFSSELENILNHRNGNTTNSESIDLVKDNSEKNEKNYNTESEISSNTIDFKSSKTEQKEQTLKEEDQNKENEIVSIPKESTNSKEQNEIITQDPNPFSCSDKTDNEPKIVLSKPNNSFLWRTLSKDNKTTSIVDKAIVNTNTQEKNDQDDVNDYEIYTYIELNAKDKEEKIVKNTSSLHLNNLPSATYQSLPNLSHCEIDDTYEELNYYTEKNYVPEIPEKKFLKEFDEVVPELPEKNRNHNMGNMTWVNASKPDIHINVDVYNSVDNVSKDYQNKNIPDLLKRGDGENLYHEPKFASERLEEKNREKRQVLTNIADKYATIVKPLKRDHGELNYNYESIVSVKDDSHYISIQDDAEVYDDVLNVIQMDNCYESIKADSECGSFWEKDNSIYGIKAPSVLSNNSTVSTDTTRTALPEPPSDVYKNITPTENDHDSFSDSFDSDSDGSSDLDSRETIHERSLPPPPTSAAQLNQNIYGFVKEAGRQVKKHWSRSSLGLNKIRKMSVGAIAQLPVVLPKSSEPDGKLSTQQPPSPISPTPLPPRGRRWSSFKTKFRTQSIFYLDDDFSSRETTPTKPSPLKTDTTPPPLPQKDFRRQSIALGSLANERDVRRQSIALRPSSPPPPPPTNRTVSTESSLNVSNKSDKILNSPSWYSDCSLFDPTANVPAFVDSDQIKHLPPQGSAYWDNLWDSGNSSTPGATSNSDSMSDPGSDLHLRFIDEPLYQFYNACIAELQFNEGSVENGYEEIGSSPMRTSMLEIIAPPHMNRSLWCQLPEVIDSGVLDTLDAGERKLQEAKFELITSEASYFKSLTVLEKHFIASPLLDDVNILSKNDRKHLFGNVTAVRKCSERLLAALEQCWQDSILLTNICEIVYQHVTNKSFNIYIKYCSNQFHIDRTLKSLRETNPKFIEALTELESDPVCQSLSLHSFLMLPMQRVTRLPLLFDAILTRLRPNHSEYETCHTTLATLNKIVHECNEEARKMERYYEMLLLSRLIKFSLKEVKCLPVISSSRWLVRSGSMNFVNVDSKMTFARKLNKTHFYAKLNLFLFTDLLVITKKKSNGSYSVIDYCTRAMMQMAAIEDSVPPTNKYLILLTILENHEQKTVEIVLSCDTESGRQRWLEATAPPASSNPEETLYEQWDCPQVAVNHTYTAQQPDELNLQPGDVINVLRKMSDGWYHGERIRDGQKGWFPGNYTTEIASSHARAKNLKQRYRLLALSGSYLQSQELSKKKVT